MQKLLKVLEYLAASTFTNSEKNATAEDLKVYVLIETIISNQHWELCLVWKECKLYPLKQERIN